MLILYVAMRLAVAVASCPSSFFRCVLLYIYNCEALKRLFLPTTITGGFSVSVVLMSPLRCSGGIRGPQRHIRVRRSLSLFW